MTRPLTPQQTEVARLVARDMCNKEIAQTLGLSTETVKTHLAGAFLRLGLRSRVGLAVWVARQ